MPQPTVSAVIPVYNNGPFIAAAIRSVLDQTRTPTEIIVVDDGSTDNTAAELKPYLPCIKYVYQQNRGEPSARNRGIIEATGDYIAFLDGDDLWAPNKLELQMEYLRQHPNCSLVYADMSTFSDQGIIDTSVKRSLHMSFPSGRIFSHLFKRPLFGSGTVVLQKNCVHAVGYFDEELLVGCDYEMWMRIALNFDIGFVDKPLLMYRYHPTMSTLGTGRKMYNGVPWEVAVLRKILQRYSTVSDEIGSTAVNRRLSKPYADLAVAQFRLNDYENARPLIRKAVELWPTNIRYWAFYAATFLHPSQIATARKLYRNTHFPFNARRSANSD